MKLPHLTCAALIVFSAAPAFAEPLSLDEALMNDVAGLLLREQGTATFLAQRREQERPPEKSSGSSGGSGVSSGGGTSSGFGIGLQIGTPTAITLKFGYGGADIVLGLGAGYAFRGDFFGMSLHGDYLLTVATLVPGGAVNVTAYLGPGLWLTLFSGGYGYGVGFYYVRNDFLGLGVRFPLGVNARFASAPVEIYLELDPAVFVFPGLDIFIGASLGFRWFF